MNFTTFGFKREYVIYSTSVFLMNSGHGSIAFSVKPIGENGNCGLCRLSTPVLNSFLFAASPCI